MTTNARNLQHEALLKAWNIEFTLREDVAIASIKRDSLAQVRSIENTANAGVVESYATQMRAGAAFPPVILWSGILLDGNTRIAAAEKIGQATFAAYDIKCPSVKMAKAVAAAINQIGGDRLSAGDAYQMALVLMDDLQFNDAQVALTLGVQASTARAYRRQKTLAERVERIGITEQFSKLTKKQQTALGTIAHDQPFRDLVVTAAETKPDAKELREAIDAVLAAPSDEEAAAAVDKARQVWVPVGPAPQRVQMNKAAQQGRMSIGALLKHEASEFIDDAKVESDLPKWQAVLALAEQVVSLMRAADEMAA